MSSPLDFLAIFAGHLRRSGISFVITSGMACVHYGLQQTTKDSDWIIPADDLGKLRDLFTRLAREEPLPWRISYRQICGAPLEAEFMGHGWTSHLSIWDNPASMGHKVDIFSKPPRVRSDQIESDADGWATRHVVAQMKRTDREKDWPIVHGLGEQLWLRRQAEGLLHIADVDTLLSAWQGAAAEVRERMALRRPLLKAMLVLPRLERLHFERLFLLERLIWERVNKHRYSRYTVAWRRFFREWRKEANWQWPTPEEFAEQHQQLSKAVRAYGLPTNPLAELPREVLIETAVQEVCGIAAATRDEIAKVLPPTDELLP